MIRSAEILSHLKVSLDRGEEEPQGWRNPRIVRVHNETKQGLVKVKNVDRGSQKGALRDHPVMTSSC